MRLVIISILLCAVFASCGKKGIHEVRCVEVNVSDTLGVLSLLRNPNWDLRRRYIDYKLIASAETRGEVIVDLRSDLGGEADSGRGVYIVSGSKDFEEAIKSVFAYVDKGGAFSELVYENMSFDIMHVSHSSLRLLKKKPGERLEFVGPLAPGDLIIYSRFSL